MKAQINVVNFLALYVISVLFSIYMGLHGVPLEYKIGFSAFLFIFNKQLGLPIVITEEDENDDDNTTS